jgi:hypothetical protein
VSIKTKKKLIDDMFTKVVAYNKILKDLFLTSSKYLKNLHDALDNN